MLTGTDGMFAYKPAGTTACLLDNTDFVVLGSKVKLPIGHGFMPGDAVKFTEEDGASLDTGLTAANTYYLGTVTDSDAVILATQGGTAVTLEGDGGTGTADTPGGHINMQFAEAQGLCQIAGWEVSMTRDKIPTTSLKCKVGGAASKYVPFKTYQAGFADGTGSVRVQFTADQASLASRLLSDSMRNKQGGAEGTFYIDAVAGAGGGDMPDDDASQFIRAPLSLEGVQVGVDSEGTSATVATVNFSFSGPPTHLFSTALI